MSVSISLVEFSIPASLALGKLKTALKQKLNYIAQASEEIEISYLDTFDWRLFNVSRVVEAIDEWQSTRLCLRQLNNRQPISIENFSSEVDFAWNLPDGQLKQQLNKKLKMRALIPQVYLQVKRYPFAGLNKDQKTVSRVVLEDYQVYDPDTDRYRPFQKRLQVIPVRGYPNPHFQVLEYIKDELELKKSKKDILVDALRALERKPADYSTKSHIELTSDMRTDVASKALLREMLEVMEANEWGICDEIDSEFLHDYRIAIRKTRSVFKQIKEVFPQQALEKHLKNFHWLGSVTSPARDMDVYLLKFDNYRKMLPTELQEHIDPLHKLLEKKKRSAYAALIRTINSQRYQNFMSGYRDFLNASPSDNTDLNNAGRPVGEVANERIWKDYKRVMKEGSVISEKSPAEELHGLRISCKKLRYLIEFFQSLYDPKAIKSLVDSIKMLQDNLGEFNDLHVQAEKLKEFSTELKKQKATSKQTNEAMKLLIDHLEELQSSQRDDFARRFEAFSDRAVKKQFKQLFKAG